MRRVVVQFDFCGARPLTLWLVLEPTDVSVCLTDPGFDVDLLVTADIAAFYEVWLGRRELADAMRAGAVQLDGSLTLVRGFPTWFDWSPVAGTVRAALPHLRDRPPKGFVPGNRADAKRS